MSKYDLIIFDCDGTLVDSEGPATNAVSEVLQKMGFSKYTPDFCHSAFSSISYEQMSMILQMELGADFDLNKFEMESEKAIRKVIVSGVVPMSGAMQMLKQLKGFPKCVASNGRREYVLNALEVTDLLKFFRDDEIFTYHQAGQPKPAPDLYIFAARHMGIMDPKRCLVIEDSDTGIMAANAAGMDVVVVRRHDNPRLNSIDALSIEGFIKDLTEISQFLQD